jgi:hypothetical protein
MALNCDSYINMPLLLTYRFYLHKQMNKTCRSALDWPVNSSHCIEKNDCRIVHNQFEGTWNEVVVA